MNLKVKKLSSIIMLMVMVLSIFSPYTSLYASLSATTVTSEVVSEIKSDDLSEIEESSEVKSAETIFVDNVDEYNSLIDNEKHETLIVTKEELLKQTRASYNVEKYPHQTLMVDDFSSRFGQLMYFRVNGDIVFCIEALKNIDGIAYDQSESGSYFSSLPYLVQDQIEYISAYGISKYQETGNKDYLWATQLRIWKAIEPSKYNLDGGTSLQTELDVIKNLVNNHFNLPSFMGTTTNNAPTHKLKWNGTKYTITLTDTNNVANYKLAELGSTYGDYTISKSGNSVTISTNNHNATKKAIVPSYTPYNVGSNKYYDGGQDVFQGSADPLPMSMNIEIEPALGSLKIIKTGKELDNLSNNIVALAGAKFELLDSKGQVVRTGTTDSNGELKFLDLLIGEYLLREIGAPTGYLIAVDKDVTITTGKTTSVTIVDEKIKGKAKLQKIGQDLDDTFESLKNVEFKFYQDTNFDGSYETFVGTYLTDNKGQLTTNDLDYGNYKAVETKAVKDYYVDYEQKFQIRKNGEVVTLSNFTEPSFGGDVVLNHKIVAEIELTKKGESFLNGDDTFSSLSGAEFKAIEDVEANGTLDLLDELFAVAFPSTTQTVVTDSNGKAKFTKLDVGKSYLVFETKAPEGYVLDETVYPISKDIEHTQDKNVITYKLDINNSIIRGQVELLKVGSKECGKSLPRPNQIKDCQQVLKDVEFNIYNDVNANGILDEEEDTEDNIIETITTNENGVAISKDLKYGDYLARESKGLDNYYLNDNAFAFKITENGEIVKLNNGVAIENIEKLGQIKITKTGNELGNLNDELVLLQNAEYTIYKRTFNETELDVNSELDSEIDSECSTEVDDILYEDEIVAVLTTDENGNATSPLLSFDNYYFKETKAPTGYNIDETEYHFTVGEDNYQEVQVFDVVNTPITSNITLTKVDSKTGEKLSGAEFELLILTENEEYVNYNALGENFVTGTEGTIDLTGVHFGSYALREIKAPNGYVVNSTLIPFEVTEDGATIELLFDNSIIKSDITLTKVDSKTGEKLSGAEFELLKLDDKEEYVNYNALGDNFKTGFDGTLKLADVEFGSYALREIKAPNGYVVNSTLIPFEVTEDGAMIELEFSNQPIELSVTGSISFNSLLIIGATSLLIIIIGSKYFLKMRKSLI
ncbi:SpaA isopeptide-forming pilin-related protein [Mollicutes bacterium LVI A0039]|nr:SpaA isopeptide-forming pilin-related protein [Mollicutes bacterium LVI A0039]